MNSFAKSLYYGQISPWERSRSENPEYTNISHKINDIQIHFRNTLSTEDWEKLDELETLHIRSLSIENEDIFSYGLNIGLLLMADAIDFKNRMQ